MRTRRSPRNQERLYRALGKEGAAPADALPVPLVSAWPGGPPRYAATLGDGRKVLGKLYKGRVCACTFSNRTHAMTAAYKYKGCVIQPRMGPVFYVTVEGGNV